MWSELSGSGEVKGERRRRGLSGQEDEKMVKQLIESITS